MHAEDVAWGFRHGMPLFLLLCLAPPVPGHSRLTGWAVAAGVLATAASMSLLAARRVRGDELLDIADRQGVPVIATSWEKPQELAPLIIAGTPVMHASTTRDLYSALRLFDHREPLVMVRRESVALLSAVLEAAEMTWEPQGAGPAGTPPPMCWSSDADAADRERALKVGLALGGGGARGLAHIPVLETLDEFGVRPCAIAGTSIGAVFGAIYASGAPARRSGKEFWNSLPVKGMSSGRS
jgi:hypothetical protein